MKFFFAFLLLSLTFSCSTVSSNISIEYYNIGNDYYDVENFNKAIEYYIKALEEDDSSVNRIRFNLAIAYTESGRAKEGLEYFELLLEEDPDNLKVLQSMAYAHYLLSNIDQSLLYYDQILSIFEYDTTALYNKALILFEDEDIHEAEIILEKLYTVDSSVEVVIQLGAIYRNNENWDDFVTLYEKSIIDNEKNIELLKGLIEYYEMEESYYKVLDYIDIILSLDDIENRPELLFKKGSIIVIELNDFNTGFQVLKKAVESGYNNIAEIKKLTDTDSLLQSDQLKDYFSSRDLY